MKNPKSIEKLMMQASRQESPELEKAFENVVAVFRFIDRKEHSNHCDILNTLYNAKTKKFTYVGVAAAFFLSDNKLRRHRRNYADWFSYFFELQTQKK